MVKLKVKATHELPHYYCSDKCSPVFMKDNIISVVADGTTVALWKPHALSEKRISLLGHEKAVTALSLSPSDQKYLCSCSDDRIILWNLSGMQQDLQGGNPMGVTFGFNVGYVEHCSFSWNNLWLALCKEKEIWIIKIQFLSDGNNGTDITHYTSLETNSVQGNMCAFSPEHYDMLVIVEDCSYFKIWNLQTTTLLYQSPSLGMHTITHCAFSNNPSRLLLGTNRGVIYVYKVKQQTIPCCVLNENVGNMFNKSIEMSSGCDQPGYGSLSENDGIETSSGARGEVGCIIFGMYLFGRDSSLKTGMAGSEEEVPGFLWDTKAILNCILSPGAVVIVCCNLGLALYDCSSWECCAKLMVSDMIPGAALCPMSFSFMNFVVLGGESLDSLMCIMRTTMGKSKLNVVMLHVEDTEHIEEDLKNSPTSVITVITVMSCEPVCPKSPLRYQMSPRSSLSEYDSKTAPLKTLRKNKSSGYGKAPRMQMFCPIINKPSISQSTSKIANKSTVNRLKSLNLNIMMQSGPPVKAGNKICIWDTSGTAVHLAVSGDGSDLACSSTSSHICIVKFTNMSAEKSLNLVGHDGAINSLHFSLDSRWLVSGSNDSTARVWDWKHKKSILNIDKTTKYTKVNGKLKQDSDLCSPVSQARFFYMDQFILMATGGCLELYSHILHETESGSKILQPTMGCQRIRKIDVPTQQVTCFSAVNQFHSYLVLCGCSNRAIQVYDLNVERFLLELRDVHVRPIHELCQMEGSHTMSHPPGMYDLFLTTSLCDCVKLWDLRSARCVQKYCQHVNRAYTSGIDMSPCGRYIAVGSEDKCVYVYDTRWCADYIGRLCGLGDVVMDVAFNPCKPVLAAAALNGYITSYSAQDV